MTDRLTAMNSLSLKATALLLAAIGLGVSSASADIVETRDGSRLVGTIQGIDGGEVILATAYAGEIKVKLADVTSLQSEQPVNVRLASGTTLSGRLGGTAGNLTVQGADGTLNSTVDKVAAGWRAGAQDPEAVRAAAAAAAGERRWQYQAAVDIAGKSGNSSEFSTRVALGATLKSDQDALRFAVSYDRGESAGVRTADEIKGLVDYSSFFSDKVGWYVNTALEADDFEGIDLRSTTAAGLSYRLIKREHQTLEGRVGLSFLYEDYTLGAQVEDLGADFMLLHDWKFANWGKMNNMLRYVPAFEDLGNFRLTHDTGVDIPLGTADFWTLRIGVSNTYNSEAAAPRDKLDTSYYTRLVLTWD